MQTPRSSQAHPPAHSLARLSSSLFAVLCVSADQGRSCLAYLSCTPLVVLSVVHLHKYLPSWRPYCHLHTGHTPPAIPAAASAVHPPQQVTAKLSTTCPPLRAKIPSQTQPPHQNTRPSQDHGKPCPSTHTLTPAATSATSKAASAPASTSRYYASTPRLPSLLLARRTCLSALQVAAGTTGRTGGGTSVRTAYTGSVTGERGRCTREGKIGGVERGCGGGWGGVGGRKLWGFGP